MDTFIQDVRYGIRMLLQRPALAAVAVLSLAIGIGANTTVFSWVRSVLLEPLPGVPDTHEIIVLGTHTGSGNYNGLSFPEYRDYRDKAGDVLSGLLVQDDVIVALGDSEQGREPARLWGSLVSGNYFDVLKVRPAAGRTFLPEESETPGAHPVAVIAHSVWQRRFQGDPGVIGSSVKVAGQPFTIVGVAPENFIGTFMGLATDIWIPVAMESRVVPGSNRLNARGQRFLQSLGRLKPGISRETAAARLGAVASQLADDYPETTANRSAAVYAVWESPWGAAVALGPVLMVLSAVVGLVLLIACANVANLLLARALSRRREVAMRISLGASRTRLIRQLLTESLVLALAGGIGGIVMAYWTAGSLMAFVPPTDAPIQLNLSVDGTTLLFTLGISLITGIVFGLAPALQSSTPELAIALKDTGQTGGFGRSRLRSFLVVAQMAISLVLLIAAGLFLQSLRRSDGIDTGFALREALLVSYDLASLGYSPERGLAFHQQLLESVESLPGIRSATLARRIPLGFSGSSSSSVSIEGYEAAPREEIHIENSTVGPGYIQLMKIPLKAGRDFDGRDSADAIPSVIVNQTLAERYWPDGRAVGGRIRYSGVWRNVVGIAGDGKYHNLSEAPVPMMYVPVLQAYASGMNLIVTTEGPPANHLNGVREVFRTMEPGLPLFEVKTLAQHLEIAVFVQSMAARLLSIMGFVALLLATMGLYGVIAYAVTQRTREIGIRMALGARNGQILTMILRQGLSLAGIGVLIGVAFAGASARLLSSLLHGVSATDPVVFALVPALLILISVLASYIPARRATRSNPLISLRYD